MEQMLQDILMEVKKEELAEAYGIPRPSVIYTVHFAITKKPNILHTVEIPLAVHVAHHNSVRVHHALHVMRSAKIVVSEPGRTQDAEA